MGSKITAIMHTSYILTLGAVLNHVTDQPSEELVPTALGGAAGDFAF